MITTTEIQPHAEPRTARADLLGLSRARLEEVLAPVIDRPFRARQIYQALYERAARDFPEMTDLPRELRLRLAACFRVGLPEIASRRLAADGTCKYLLRLADGATIEAVDIPDRGRRTFCISSQAGCALACSFCVTGYWGAGRNLTAGEIVGQVLAIRADRGLAMEGLNIVFMGMGEPLLNLENVKAALDILTEWISPHRITVSTVGILPGLEEMARWEKRPNLAISLHAPDEELRGRIMPVNRTYPLAELMAALRRYPLEKGRKLTFEYVLIRDLNDRDQDADRLSRLLSGLRAKINLIPINPDPVLGERMVPPDDERIEAFKERLRRRGWIATIRRRRGDDVSAACGQLRAFGREARGFRGKTDASSR
ncbi:MAG TPA: 23S rRNA (adenine(2503)-C(2))-methyltransferase RlmN [Thermoanaerobaculia bacterium]